MDTFLAEESGVLPLLRGVEVVFIDRWQYSFAVLFL